MPKPTREPAEQPEPAPTTTFLPAQEVDRPAPARDRSGPACTRTPRCTGITGPSPPRELGSHRTDDHTRPAATQRVDHFDDVRRSDGLR